MKILSKMFLLSAVFALACSGNAFAAKDDVDYWDNYDPIIPDRGEFTEDYPVVSRILTAPVRAVSTVGGAAVGSLCGAGKGIVHAEYVVSENTFERLPNERGWVLGPAGVVGSIVAIPVGAVYGATRGFGQGTVSGFMLPEAY